jgi:hypothetical protein
VGWLVATRYGWGYLHVANVAEPADLDEGLRGLLREAYDEAAG